MEPEFTAAVSELKATIRVAAASALKTFTERTGVTPDQIEIQMLRQESAGGAARHILGDVHISFSL